MIILDGKELVRCRYCLVNIDRPIILDGPEFGDDSVDRTKPWLIEDLEFIGTRPSFSRSKYTLRLEDGRELDFYVNAQRFVPTGGMRPG